MNPIAQRATLLTRPVSPFFLDAVSCMLRNVGLIVAVRYGPADYKELVNPARISTPTARCIRGQLERAPESLRYG